MGRAFEFRKARKMKRWSAMSKAFTRIGKDIVIAVKEGGPDPDSNSKLRAVIQNAKSVNMPKDNIERAIKRASDKSVGDYKEILFEGYGPSGIAILVETATDNNTRTVANIRSYFNKYNITLDPHTAVGVMCGKKQKLSEDILVTLSTAHPAKFKETVSEIISDNSFITDKVKSLDTLEEHMIIANKNANDIKKLIDNHVA